ncbi:hypothetical protein D3C84_860900 [compost metagenome]
MVVLFKAIFGFQGRTKLAERAVIPKRLVQRQPGRMNFVDRDMYVQVVRVVVYGAYSLMLCETQPGTNTLLNLGQDLCRWLLASAETDKQVVGFI